MEKVFEIETLKCKVESINESIDPMDIIQRYSKNEEQRSLLAHADDGVIWGNNDRGEWHFSGSEYPDLSPLLRTETLQQLRIFNKKGEVFIWKEGGNWAGRLIEDKTGEETSYYDEHTLLWGTEQIQDAKAGFYFLQEADLGIKHTPPSSFSRRRNLKLIVRNYLGEDEFGSVFVKYSRLVDLVGGAE